MSHKFNKVFTSDVKPLELWILFRKKTPFLIKKSFKSFFYKEEKYLGFSPTKTAHGFPPLLSALPLIKLFSWVHFGNNLEKDSLGVGEFF